MQYLSDHFTLKSWRYALHHNASNAQRESVELLPQLPKTAVPPITGRASGLAHLGFADALRAFAILLVVLHHLLLFGDLKFRGHHFAFPYLGVWGVNCFFVLSGFLLGAPYVSALITDRPLPNARRFLIRRVLRIYPLYFVAIMISIGIAALYSEHFSTHDVFAHIFLLQNMWETTIISINGPLWTMGIDALFYLTLPLLAFIVRPVVRSKGMASLAMILTALFILSVGYRIIQIKRFPNSLTDAESELFHVRNFLGYGCAFAVGVAVAAVRFARGKVSARVVTITALTGSLIALAEFAISLAHRSVQGSISSTVLATLDPVTAIAVGLILFSFSNPVAAPIMRWTNWFLVSESALLAYAVYLIHWPVITFVATIAFHDRLGTYGSFAKLVSVSALILIPSAFILNRFIEQPFLKLKAERF